MENYGIFSNLGFGAVLWLRAEYTHSDSIFDIEEEITFCTGSKVDANAYTLQHVQILICVRILKNYKFRVYLWRIVVLVILRLRSTHEPLRDQNGLPEALWSICVTSKVAELQGDSRYN